MLDIEDKRWHKISSRMLYGVIDGVKIGVVMATNSNPNFPDTYALNVAEFNRLRDGKDHGKIDEAYIVAVEVNGGERVYRGEMSLEEATLRLSTIVPRDGRFGKFWSLPVEFFGVDVPF
jgi:hypothetical protein